MNQCRGRSDSASFLAGITCRVILKTFPSSPRCLETATYLVIFHQTYGLLVFFQKKATYTVAKPSQAATPLRHIHAWESDFLHAATELGRLVAPLARFYWTATDFMGCT